MQIAQIQFDLPLHPAKLSAFRAAIAQTIGLQHERFHNHKNTTGQPHYHWSYPLIQYKVHRGCAAITALGEGRDDLYRHLLPNLPMEFTMAGRPVRLNNFQLTEQEYHWTLREEPFTYGLTQWLALNGDNYRQWKANDNQPARLQLLSQALTGQLRVFAEAVGIPATDLVVGQVLDIHNTKKMYWHGQHFVGFDALISSTISLPKNIGIGRCVAFGFGHTNSPGAYLRRQRIKGQRRGNQVIDDVES